LVCLNRFSKSLLTMLCLRSRREHGIMVFIGARAVVDVPEEGRTDSMADCRLRAAANLISFSGE